MAHIIAVLAFDSPLLQPLLANFWLTAVPHPLPVIPVPFSFYLHTTSAYPAPFSNSGLREPHPPPVVIEMSLQSHSLTQHGTKD